MTSNIEGTLRKFDTFINDVLKEDLKKLQDQLNEINKDILDLTEQRRSLEVITDKKLHPDGFKTLVTLGCNFFMDAAVADTSIMLVNVGLNHYVELTVPEANKVLDAMIVAKKKKADEILAKAADTSACIKYMLLGIDTIVNI